MAEKIERWEPVRKSVCFTAQHGWGAEFVYRADPGLTLEAVHIRVASREISLDPEQARELFSLLQQELPLCVPEKGPAL